MNLSDFNFELPQELIAQEPKDRGKSKLLVLCKETGNISHEKDFSQIVNFFKEGDVLVRNNTKVIPARLFGEKTTGVKTEVLLNRRIPSQEENIQSKKFQNVLYYEVILDPGRRYRGEHERIIFKKDILEAEVVQRKEEIFTLRFEFNGVFEEVLQQLGEIPLPKYIKKELKDQDRYQTIYAKEGLSSAAPTAGLHFTHEIFEKLQEKGVQILDINLNIGLGTFAPIWHEDIQRHQMHTEDFFIEEKIAKEINRAKKEGRRIIALGTTSVRALESATENGKLRSGHFETNIFIKPGFKFQIVDMLITNFHLPKSSLLMLVSAFAGREKILRAYRKAVKHRYHFFSFGDAMLIKKCKKII